MSIVIEQSAIKFQDNDTESINIKDAFVVVADPVNNTLQACNVNVERNWYCICKFICVKQIVQIFSENIQISPADIESLEYNDVIDRQEIILLRLCSCLMKFLCSNILIIWFAIGLIIISVYYSVKK